MKIIYTLIFLITTLFVNSQNNSLRINPNIVLPKDSAETEKLITSLNDLLLYSKKPNEENIFILDNEKIETFILVNVIKDIEKSTKYNDDFFYKPYLTNIISLDESKYLIQLSYIGVSENTALLRASFSFIAHKVNNSFKFSSSLLYNTKNWKEEKYGKMIFHYQNTLNEEKAKEFNRLTTLFDSKLNVANRITEYYCTNNIIELHKLIGIDYLEDNNGRVYDVWSSSFEDKELIILGNKNANFNEFDSHDLFHERLSLVIQRSKVNKPVDEGCAYLYGGSWGLTWEEIFKAFKQQIASNKNISWTEIKENPVYFKTKQFNNSADYIVNALLVKKIEKEKGFVGVWELLNVGPFEKGNEKYYQVLEKLTGITKANYNERVSELINKEKL